MNIIHCTRFTKLSWPIHYRPNTDYKEVFKEPNINQQYLINLASFTDGYFITIT